MPAGGRPEASARAHDPSGTRASERRPLLAALVEPHAFRLRVAILMAAVSLASAYVTHVATERGSAAAALNGLASQQRAEEQQVEQQIDAVVAQDLRLTARLDEHWHTYQRSFQQADDLRSTQPEQAAQLDLVAQASLDQVRQMLPFFRGAIPDLSGDVPVYDAAAARDVLRFQDWRLFRASSDLTRQEATEADGAATSTVLVVVTMVGSLFLLTLGHLVRGRRGLAPAGLGVALAIGALAWFTAIEPATALPLLVGGIVLAAALAVTRLPGVRRLLQGMELEEAVLDVVSVPTRPEAQAVVDPGSAPTNRFTRYVAIAIASVTLLGAWVGFLQGNASGDADEAAWTARDHGVESIGALRAAEEQMAVAVETYQLALSQRVDSWAAAQRASYAQASGDAAQAARLRAEATRLEELAARSEERSGVAGELGSTGVSSELVLRNLRAGVWETAARLGAQQDAANATSRSWGERAAIYLSVLAWLAVAAYLLGLSLVFRERPVRVLLASVGTVLIVASAVRTATVWTQPGATREEDAQTAAEAYAEGFVAQQRSDPARALDLFGTAIGLRDDFGIARRERAQAILESGSAAGVGIRSVFTVDAVNLAIADLTSAREHGAETAGVLLNMAAMLFHRSIQTGSEADMAQSIALSREGLELGRAFGMRYGRPHINQLIGELNLALALAGSGQPDEAAAIYRDMSAEIRQLALYLRPYLVGAGLSTLGILGEASDPVPEATIVGLKELLVAESYGAAAGSPAEVASAEVQLFASILQWRATIPGFDATRDTLVTQWYRFDPGVDGWSALPLVSGPQTLGAEGLFGQFYPDAGEDAYWGNSNAMLRDVPPTCIRPGRYRLELYLNGRLQATAEADSPAEAYTPHLARDVGVAMCQPPDWTPSGVVPGISTGVVAPDGSRGVAVFRVYEPRTPTGPDSRVTALERVVASGQEGLPEGIGIGFALDPTTEPTIFGRNDGVWRLHAYPGGLAKTSATLVGSGTVLVVCAYGPEAWIVSAEAEALILSLITH